MTQHNIFSENTYFFIIQICIRLQEIVRTRSAFLIIDKYIPTRTVIHLTDLTLK